MSTKRKLIPAPAPGVYEDVPNAEYQLWDCISNSGLKAIEKCPAEYRWLRDNLEPLPDFPPTIATGAMAIGTAVHTLLLEPEKAPMHVHVLGNRDYRTKEAKDGYRGLVEQNPHKVFLRPELEIKATEMASAALANDDINKVLASPGRRELSVVHETLSSRGRPCTVKVRIDATVETDDVNVLGDVKTCISAAPGDFAKAIANFGYHRQAGLYRAVCLERTDLPNPEAFLFLCVENREPYMPEKCAVYWLDENEAMLGLLENRDLMDVYLDCVESGHWPGYADGIQKIERPYWARKRAQSE